MTVWTLYLGPPYVDLWAAPMMCLSSMIAPAIGRILAIAKSENFRIFFWAHRIKVDAVNPLGAEVAHNVRAVTGANVSVCYGVHGRSKREQSNHDRLQRKVCHFSYLGPEVDAAVSTALELIGGKMAEFISNSAIPREGSMRTSWPALRNPYYANQRGVNSGRKWLSWPADVTDIGRIT